MNEVSSMPNPMIFPLYWYSYNACSRKGVSMGKLFVGQTSFGNIAYYDSLKFCCHSILRPLNATVSKTKTNNNKSKHIAQSLSKLIDNETLHSKKYKKTKKQRNKKRNAILCLATCFNIEQIFILIPISQMRAGGKWLRKSLTCLSWPNSFLSECESLLRFGPKN